MAKKLKAFGDGLIIKPTNTARETPSGILIADMGQERPETGIIVDIGPGAYSITGNWIPTTLKKGQEVVIPKVGTTSITVGDDTYLITKEREVSSYFEDDEVETEPHAELY